MRTALALVGLLALGGCASVAPQDATDAPMPYACADGKRFIAAYDLKGDKVRVAAGGTSYVLPHARAASGVRYAKRGVELHTKGDAAVLDGAAGGPYRDCRTG